MLDLHPKWDVQEDDVVDGEQSRIRGAAIGLIALLVIAVAAVVVVVNGTGSSTPAAQPPAPSSAAPSAQPTTSSARTAQPPSAQLPTALPTAAPPNVTWSIFQTVALPFSAADGPSRIDGPVYAGYSHSPTGALLAAAQIAIRYSFTPGDSWRAVLEQQVVDNAGRSAFAAVRAKVTDDTVQPGSATQYAGFAFDTYTTEVAVLELVSRLPTGGYQGATVTVKWIDGDWRVELQPDGSVTSNAHALASLAGYIPWGGI